jgi:hypothetical protein
VLSGGPAGTWAATSSAERGVGVVLADKGFCGTSGATAGTGVWYVDPDPAKRSRDGVENAEVIFDAPNVGYGGAYSNTYAQLFLTAINAGILSAIQRDATALVRRRARNFYYAPASKPRSRAVPSRQRALSWRPPTHSTRRACPGPRIHPIRSQP